MIARALLALAAAAAVAGCGLPGTCDSLVLHESGVTLTIENARPETIYDVAIDADGSSLVLRIGDTSPSMYGTVESDSGELRAQALVITDLTVEPAVYLIEAHVWLDDSSEDEVGPETLTVTVTSDGIELLSDTLTPTYSRSEPEGRYCPAYESATASASLP